LSQNGGTWQGQSGEKDLGRIVASMLGPPIAIVTFSLRRTWIRGCADHGSPGSPVFHCDRARYEADFQRVVRPVPGEFDLKRIDSDARMPDLF
jgi:hypothetical protein